MVAKMCAGKPTFCERHVSKPMVIGSTSAWCVDAKYFNQSIANSSTSMQYTAALNVAHTSLT